MRRWGLAVLVTLSCSAIAKEQLYSPPRLDNGQPDMQGVWVASNATPLQRPAGYSTLVIAEAQAAKLLASRNARFEDRSSPTEPTEYFEPHAIERIRGQLRSSLIVDPPDGLIPGNDLFKQQVAHARAAMLTAMDGPEQRPAPERCLASQTTQPPILAISVGVNLHQIVQTADSFVFVSEFVGAARIVRLDSQPVPAAITSWLGDSIGHWQGDEFTVEDPTYYTKPWTGESQFQRRDEQLLEYACHEANYSLVHILEGARERERQ
jgi:hypothetical protein